MAAMGWLVGATEINVSINSLVTVVTAFAQHLTPCSSTGLLGAEAQGKQSREQTSGERFSLPWPGTVLHPVAQSLLRGPVAGRYGLLGKMPSLPRSTAELFTTSV